jgi:hypothetical protein
MAFWVAGGQYTREYPLEESLWRKRVGSAALAPGEGVR